MIHSLIKESLDAELEISSIDIADKTGLDARRHRGSFYTPLDAAQALWINLLHCHSVHFETATLKDWVRRTHFVDPACGTGIFLFSLLDLLSKVGLAIEDVLPDLRFTCVDNNLKACEFLEQSILQLYDTAGLDPDSLDSIDIVHGDGIEYLKSIAGEKERRDLVIVGNPPYVTLRSTSEHVWDDPGFKVSDLYGLFLYWAAVAACHHNGAVGMIVPLSVGFSRHHADLRRELLALRGRFHLAHFDNIPDSIFKAGKPDSVNTNRANSQRVTYFCCSFRSGENRTIESSRLIAWQSSQRAKLLSEVPQTFRVEPLDAGLLIPKPGSVIDATLLGMDRASGARPIRDLVTESGTHSVWISATARNYLAAGLQQFKDSGLLQFRFENERDAVLVFALLASSLFLDYWKCVGDGFHVTSTNILNFPIPPLDDERVEVICEAARTMWVNRSSFKKIKLNAGKSLVSYDFTNSNELGDINKLLVEAVLDSSHQG